MKDLVLLVTYITKPGCREAFVRELIESGVHAAVNAEDGCHKYDYYFDAQNEDQVLLVEKWESREKARVHLKTPHMTVTAKAIKDKYMLDMKMEEID